MKNHSNLKTLGELKDSGYNVTSVKKELRRNLITKIKAQEDFCPDVKGFENTVIPQLENAVLAGQDIILLGERGQAKSRLIRNMVALLDENIPTISGCDINDNPFDPICLSCKEKLREFGNETVIKWLSKEERYSEKLATPDISVSDLIGEIDPIKVAEGRYLSDELTIHYGLIPRTNRGIFCINELPDLSERIQVSLFNLMQERDIQIKGHKILLPLDVLIVSSANPEDYTNRGRIITPLKDRYGAQIRTHYPKIISEEIAIMEQEHTKFTDTSETVITPYYMKEIIAEFTALARRSSDINQQSGVSLRVSIANFETILGAAFKRSFTQKGKVSPRISDLPNIASSTIGKFELETVEENQEHRIVEDLTKAAILNIFSGYFKINDFSELIKQFEEGMEIMTGADLPSSHYVNSVANISTLQQHLDVLNCSSEPCEIASAVEFILEGLHLNKLINKDYTGRYASSLE